MIAVIGGGVAGNYLSYLLAKNGYDVKVFEEHKKVGSPVQCTGIVGESFKRIIHDDSFVVNKIHKARIYSPDRNFVEVNFRKPNLILNRAGLDKYLMKKAEKRGAEYFIGKRITEVKNSKIAFESGKKTTRINADYIIGADGPLSTVAKQTGLFRKRRFFVGIQATARMENDNAVEFFPINRGIAWIVPESKKRVRIGIAVRNNAKRVFDRFTSEHIGKDRIIELQAGLIPEYDPKIRTRKGNVFLIGDAATMVKATTLGGIVQSLTAARCLCRSFIEKRDYEKEWRSAISRELYVSLMMRQMMDKFSANDYNQLVHLFNSRRMKRLLDNLDRDFLAKSVIEMAIKEPRLLAFARKLL
ncbi:MAG: NAD(P)/FAD-dependent oxidoreductase [bacterium]|nr:NAD(P)/FAD-dependent oxidoreductase [bacterium]